MLETALFWLALFLFLPMPLSDTKIAGWPELITTEHLVSTKEVGDACQIGKCGVVLGCAHFELDAGTCDIWVSTENPSWPNVLKHERLHCQGYAHRNNMFGCGGDDMQDVFAKWKARQL